MSLADVATKTKECLSDIYAELEKQGATIPEQKNLINVAPAIESIESIEGGGGETQPQVHNYLMLYDGTLGEAGKTGANLCVDVTSGWQEGLFQLSSYHFGSYEYATNSLKIAANSFTEGGSSSYPARSMASIGTVNKINVSNYIKYASVYSVTSQSMGSKHWCGIYISKDSSNNVATLFNNVNTNGLKTLSSVALSTAEEGYPRAYISTTSQNYGYPSLEIFGMFLVKQDIYQPVLDLAGITTVYEDEASICADETAMTAILNNKEAVEYMIYNCTGTFMLAFLQSETALNALNSSPYKLLVYQNDVWTKFLSMIA